MKATNAWVTQSPPSSACRPHWTKQFGIGLLALVSVLGGVSFAVAKEPKATPYRPTVSNPAYLPIPNYLEIEMGWQSLKDKSEDEYQHSLPYLLKYAFTDRLGVLVSGNALIFEDNVDTAAQGGFGDVSVLLNSFNHYTPRSLRR